MVRVALHVRPGARLEAVRLLADGTLDVQVRAPALDGRANTAVLRLLASVLGLRPRQVRLLRGEHSRQKLVEIDLDLFAALTARLTVAASAGAV
jgi:uncharacterized protein